MGFAKRLPDRCHVDACKQYLNHQPDYPGLYLLGKCETGKTHLAGAIARDLLFTGHQVMFTSVSGLCYEETKAMSDRDKITEQEAAMAYISCENLVLDDLGVGQHTEWDKKTIELYHLRAGQRV
jgi:DNA replication protein DnaC